mmetsp:Transcript_14454/g.38080  ORF Transcript_14454/g.38080 Transcript_14454/m.38080 type:complete len:81 (-) Transcript_14454:37-279(-)
MKQPASTPSCAGEKMFTAAAAASHFITMLGAVVRRRGERAHGAKRGGGGKAVRHAGSLGVTACHVFFAIILHPVIPIEPA